MMFALELQEFHTRLRIRGVEDTAANAISEKIRNMLQLHLQTELILKYLCLLLWQHLSTADN